MTDGALLELKLIGDIAGSFRVPRYQRGYRWGEAEVKRLLDDVWDSKGAPYCLQPVVVKDDGEGTWELVDGQQRLTTIYLIFVYLLRHSLKNVAPPFTLSYDTREKSKEYLGSLDPALASTNIDFFHLHTAYASIGAWFEQNGPTALKRQVVADDLFGYLCKSVSLIWYVAPRELNATTLFTRLNVGKIPLTDAELFKALLLSSSRKEPGASDRSHEIAAQWDNIERDLRQPEVWAFVAEAGTEPPTRITLLLDTIAGGPQGRQRPRFHTFDVLRAEVASAGWKAVWDRVVDLHALVLGWYEDRDLFHKVGYLVSVGATLSSLIQLAQTRTKSEFGSELDALIQEKLDLSRSDVMTLSYDTESDKNDCFRLLVLMNVETVRGLTNSTERYSFGAHREAAWSLEHIHAQRAEALTKAAQWMEWLRLHRLALIDLQSVDDARRNSLLQRIDGLQAKLDPAGGEGERRKEEFQSLARDITAEFTVTEHSDAASMHSLHSITNLALLAGDHNSALNNAVFEVKRRKVIKLDQEGEHIPICTKRVFLKYYANADVHQVHFWSAQDRESYLDAILSPKGGVGRYLKPEVPQT